MTKRIITHLVNRRRNKSHMPAAYAQLDNIDLA
eukprot:CAMPEP_0194437098 /NCGR_PEP_ID=MMETSP0176-20130528/98150_1 /TAXON_ID=216777 /ORGANISM="Proboscia alata, Strain PI-D3" /LENGTH=32 /DNA_ID= /DNA_START= /DNA_END= /DNA_ORIENTATION=